MPPSTPTNFTREPSPSMLVGISLSNSDCPPLLMKKLHVKVQVQSSTIFKKQTDSSTLHLTKDGGREQASHLPEYSLHCSLG